MDFFAHVTRLPTRPISHHSRWAVPAGLKGSASQPEPGVCRQTGVGRTRAGLPLASRSRTTEAADRQRAGGSERMSVVRDSPPRTKYARSGGLNIAYQVIGNGPFDLLYAPGFISHLEAAWEVPFIAGFFERLASFSRLIAFDKRGTGLSDRPGGWPTFEQRMDDVREIGRAHV